MSFTVIIPARLASVRLPNKPLLDIDGVPMVVRVAQRVLGGVSAGSRVVVAGDDVKIIEACSRYGINAILTSCDHLSGSDRLAEACDILALEQGEIVVNVQGDEPLINPTLVQSVANLLTLNSDSDMSTAAHPINHWADYVNPNVVKVVLNQNLKAMYFSRAPIAWSRETFSGQSTTLPTPRPLRHIGIYAYRVAFLRKFPALSPAPIELAESLEQLRALWHGYEISVFVSDLPVGQGVDTPADLDAVRAIFATIRNSSV
jgi:3-deoxy-manno-octulosonate cytidylyltransferase (CMP-KDO synthetase)